MELLWLSNPCASPYFSFERALCYARFLQQWSPLLAALLVIISVVHTGMILRKTRESVQERRATLEKNIESIRNVLEGHQGMVEHRARFDLH